MRCMQAVVVAFSLYALLPNSNTRTVLGTPTYAPFSLWIFSLHHSTLGVYGRGGAGEEVRGVGAALAQGTRLLSRGVRLQGWPAPHLYGRYRVGEKNVTLVTADKLARGLGLTLAGLLLELERGSDGPESE